MRRNKWIAAAVALCSAAASVVALATGDVEIEFIAQPDEHPEGVAFDRDGNLYYGIRIDADAGGFENELWKASPNGSKRTRIATFADSPQGANGILGLVADGDGNVWAAVDGGSDNGVWRVSSNGKKRARVDGSEDMDFPNALTFDAEGNLYVTNSGPVSGTVGGAIWRLPRGATRIEVWSEDPALAPFPFDPFPGFTLPGANGIAFYPPNSLYVANTEKGQLLRIGIGDDGEAEAAEAITALFALPSADGIAVDVFGDVHVVLPGHAVLPLFGLPAAPPLVRVDPDTGAISRSTLAAFDAGFDNPLSLAFDPSSANRETVVIANGNVVPIPGLGPGPRLLRANVGVKGYPQK